MLKNALFLLKKCKNRPDHRISFPHDENLATRLGRNAYLQSTVL